MVGTLFPNYLAETNLRLAERYDVVQTELSTINVAAATEVIDAVFFDPPEVIEILAVALHVITTITADATAAVPARASRQRHATRYNLTTRDTADAGGARREDYGTWTHHTTASEAFEDEVNGTGGVFDGSQSQTWVIMDPGHDGAELPLILDDSDRLRVHRILGAPGIAADEEMQEFIQLHVWFEEAEEADTEVRTQFPSARTDVTI